MVDRAFYEAHMDGGNVTTSTAGNGQTDSTSGQGGKADVGSECVVLLHPDFAPTKWDVICQRGKECFEHVGNRRFRMCIDKHLDDYMKVKSRPEKSRIVTAIVESIRRGAANSGGGFVRKDLLTRRWFKVGDKLAREKVGQALRDAIKTRRAASSSSLQKSGKKSASGSASTISSAPSVTTLPTALSSQDQQRMPNIIQGMVSFQPLEPRLEDRLDMLARTGHGSDPSSDTLWSLLKEEASQKFKNPDTASSFWDVARVAPLQQQQPHVQQSHSSSNISVGVNRRGNGVDLEPTPFLDGSTRRDSGFDALLKSTGANSPNADQRPEMLLPNDVYSNSEASRKKVLGMFKSMLPEMGSAKNANRASSDHGGSLATGSISVLEGSPDALPGSGAFTQTPEYQKALEDTKRADRIVETQNRLLRQLQQQQEQQLSASLRASGGPRRLSSEWFLQPSNDEVFDMNKLPW